jgi:hypothetical protein
VAAVSFFGALLEMADIGGGSPFTPLLTIRATTISPFVKRPHLRLEVGMNLSCKTSGHFSLLMRNPNRKPGMTGRIQKGINCEIDRMSAAAEGIVTVEVDMLPSDRGDFFEKSQCFGAFGRGPWQEPARRPCSEVRDNDRHLALAKKRDCSVKDSGHDSGGCLNETCPSMVPPRVAFRVE